MVLAVDYSIDARDAACKRSLHEGCVATLLGCEAAAPSSLLAVLDLRNTPDDKKVEPPVPPPFPTQEKVDCALLLALEVFGIDPT